MLCLENTHNRGGGKIQPFDQLATICRWAHDEGLSTHLDGARLFNAVVTTGIDADRWAEHFDTVSVCFSKGLGAPVGSALCGSREAIRAARRHRKVLGGGMRQAGIIAAAALYALDHQVERLAEDHATARQFARGIAGVKHLNVQPDEVETNIVMFNVEPALGTAAEFASRLDAAGLRVLALGPQQIRAVTHLPVTEDEIRRAIEIVEQVATTSSSAPSAAPSRSVYAG